MLTDIYYPHINGVTNHIWLLGKALKQLGHDVSVITFGDSQPGDAEEGVLRNPAVSLGSSGYYLGLRYTKASIDAMSQSDLIHLHHPFLSGRLATAALADIKKPLVFTCHTRYDLYAKRFLSFIPETLLDNVVQTQIRGLSDHCDIVIAPNCSTRKRLRAWGVKSEIAVIPNAIDTQVYKGHGSSNVRASLGIPRDSLLVIYCGRLSSEKSVETLLRAMELVVSQMPAAYLIIVGGGPEENKLQQRWESRPWTRFIGEISYNAVPDYLAASDLYVSASLTEVNSLAILEALASSLPVVLSDSSGNSDIVTNGIEGLLVSASTPVSFAEAIVDILSNNEKRSLMSEMANETSEAFDIRDIAMNVVALYKGMVSQQVPS
ncbi:MAG: glycosyltransferase [Chloroflexota bacterium]